MRARFGLWVGLSLVALTAACGPFAAQPRPDQEIITRAEMLTRNFKTAYEAVQALHSNWLIERPLTFGVSAPNPQIVVYENSVRLGGADELRNLLVQNIAYIRHYTPTEATTRFGVGHPQGAIVVSTDPL